MSNNIKNSEEKLQNNYIEIPEKVAIELSGDQAAQVLIMLAAFAKQKLEMGMMTVEEWEERERVLKIFIEATNHPIKCPKMFVHHLENISQSLVALK